MAVNEQHVMTSHNLLNYSGMLFKKGDTSTPFSTLIGGKSRNVNHWEFVTSLAYASRGGDTQPAITETQSLTAPNPKFSTREQATNVCQIFQEALAISYGKLSSMGQLSGLNIAGQEANPATELDFQVAITMEEIRKNIEYTFINGTYQKGGYDDVAYKTRGILEAITTNAVDGAGAKLDFWTVAEALTDMKKNGLNADGVVLMAPGVHIMQINADAVKASAGALMRMDTCKVPNLRVAAYYLKQSGFKLVAATEKTENLIYDVDMTGPTAIIMGSEGKGISQSMLELADDKAAIPMAGEITSLNVSVASAVLMYEAVRQRIAK